MATKYTIYDQLTATITEASTYEEALSIQNNLINTYIETVKPYFHIAAMVSNKDGIYTQYEYDENGDPIITPRPGLPDNISRIDVTSLGDTNAG
jgi:hypothetical protein